MKTVIMAAALVAIFSPALGSTVIGLGMDELIGWSDVIVSGTVHSTKAHWNDRHTEIYTDVVLTGLIFVKGERNSLGRMSLQFRGGTVGDTTCIASGVPTFKLAERVILFLATYDSAGCDISPVVGLYQGRFSVIAKPGKEEVIDCGGRALVGFRDDNIILLGDSSSNFAESVVRYPSGTPPQPTNSVAVGAENQQTGGLPPGGITRGSPPSKLLDTKEQYKGARPNKPIGRIEGTFIMPIILPVSEDTGERVSEAEFLDWLRQRTARGGKR